MSGGKRDYEKTSLQVELEEKDFKKKAFLNKILDLLKFKKEGKNEK